MKKILFLSQLYLIIMFLSVANAAFSAQKKFGAVQSEESKRFFAKEWLSENATLEQKKLIVHARTKFINNEAFILKGGDLTTFQTFPQHVQEYLLKNLGNLCGDEVRDCNTICSCFKKPIGMHAYLFQPTEEELRNFDNDGYWQKRVKPKIN